MSLLTAVTLPFITRKLLFLSKLSTIAGGILLLSYFSNANPTVRRLLQAIPWTGKKAYYDGERTPLSRGFLHGGMSLLHAVRAFQTRSIPHTFLVLQYSASFLLHNYPYTIPNEHRIATIDNLCIASHIALLGSLGAPQNTYASHAALLAALSTSVGLAYKLGTGSWAYKVSLMPIFAAGALTWHASGRLYLPGSPRIPFIYIAAFAVFALHKRGVFHANTEKASCGDGLLSAVTYDLFHGLQVVATLATLRQVGQF